MTDDLWYSYSQEAYDQICEDWQTQVEQIVMEANRQRLVTLLATLDWDEANAVAQAELTEFLGR